MIKIKSPVIKSQEQIWTSEWSQRSTASEIKMWDFYLERPWILKYVPRYGIVLEAGCGLGRYVFYLAALGIDIIGIDFVSEALHKIQEYMKKNKVYSPFCQGDVRKLCFKDNSLSGYISLGVIEHFEEGPDLAMQEAYRVLRPGGIAIITTPSVSFSQIYLQSKLKVKKSIKYLIKKIIRYPIYKPYFFQYWYLPKTLKKYLEKSGFKIVLSQGADLMYSFYELGYQPARKSWFTELLFKLENTPMASIGAQAISISYKPAQQMYCFLCGHFNVHIKELTASIPLCQDCQKKPLAKHYIKANRLKFQSSMLIHPEFNNDQETCDYCGKEYAVSKILEYYGFSKNVCSICLKNSEINLNLSNTYIQPVWRLRT